MEGLLKQKWGLEIDRGPDWLFIRLHPDSFDADNIAERLWEILDRHFIYRLVLELDDIDFLPSHMMGQLVMLQNRVMQHDGALRLCGMTPECEQALHLCRLDKVLPNFHCREDAVLGFVHAKPR